jgi:hypothetical protein
MKRYTNEEIISVISKYTHLKDFREENLTLYNALVRRINGKRFFDHLIKQHGGRPRKEKIPKQVKKIKEKVLNKNGERKPSSFFPLIVIDGVEYCGRCKTLMSAVCERNKNICKKCAAKCYSLTYIGHDLNPWNIRDQFVGSTIHHYEKTFKLELHADDNLREYLTAVGYAFIFKDVYDEVIRVGS